MKKASEEYKCFNRELNLQEQCSSDQVIDELKNLWKYKFREEKNLINLKRELKRLEREINDEKRELQKWTDYRDYGQFQIATQLRLLKKELDEMTENYNIISRSIKVNINDTIESIKSNTEQAIQKKNILVAQRAFNHIDKSVVDMSHENKWMEKQVEIVKIEIARLEKDASVLEKENINLMGHLFDCNNEEFNCIKSLFDFQFLEDDNLEDNSIMKVDLEELDCVRSKSSLEMSLEKFREIEMKITSLQELKYNKLEGSKNQTTNFQETYHSPRILCLYGTKKKLIKSEANDENETLKEDPSYTIQYWPITQSMLRDVLNS